MRQTSDVARGSFTTHAAASGGRELFDALEPRQLLTLTSPMPDVANLVDERSSVVRIVTAFGDIDIEFFRQLPDINQAELEARFLRYVDRGELDQTFFHRLVPGSILQGGGFLFDDADGLSPVFQREPAPEAFRLSNVERTVALANIDVQGETVGSQFFFNLADNSATFDPQGIAVIGRVVDDESWAVVMTIANLPVVDMSGSPAFAGEFAGNFTQVPGGPTPTEDNLVTIRDIEVIRVFGNPDFFDEHIHYPEGFAGATINEFLPLTNPNSVWLQFQVIVRAEVPQGFSVEGYSWFRDRVIAYGEVAPNGRGGITISHFGPGGAPSLDDLVPQGVPYAIEVRSTLPIGGNLSHYDFGSATGENFIANASETWTFAEGSTLDGSVNQFLVWYNPEQTPVNVTVTFFLDNGSTRTANVTTDRYRRGGLYLNDLADLPDGSNFSIRVEADHGIVAALTGYDTRDDQSGFTELGIAGAGSTRGVLPMGVASATSEQFVSFFNPSTTDTAPITLIFSYSDGSNDFVVSPASLQLAAGRRATFNIGNIPEVNDGRRFTLRYSSGNVGVFAHARNAQFTDEVAYPVGVDAATRWLYAEGFVDPARAGNDVFETLSLFNPNFGAMGRADIAVNVQVRFLFDVAGTIRDPGVVETFTVAPGGRLDINIDQLASIINHVTETGHFYYGIQVVSDAPIVSQVWHHDLTLGGLQPSGGFGELGAPGGDIVRLG